MLLVPALTLLAAALALLLSAPALLTVGHWQVRSPRLALTLWFVALFTGCAMVVGSVVCAVICGLTAHQVHSTATAVAMTVLSWFSLGLVGAAAAVIVASVEPLVRSHRRAVGRLPQTVLRREPLAGDRRCQLVWVRADEPVAVAVPGRTDRIVVSSALAEALTPAELRAVIAHEHAHLRRRHDWAVRLAELNALCLPRGLAAGRALKRATTLLIELIADDDAARRVGPAVLVGALRRFGRLTADPGLLLRADRLQRQLMTTGASTIGST